MEFNKVIKVSTLAEIKNIILEADKMYYIEDSKIYASGQHFIDCKEYEQSEQYKKLQKEMWYGK